MQLSPSIHPTYNWDIVCFLAGDCLFKIPRQPLIACSETFATIYGLNCDQWSPGTDGYSADKPIHLPDCVSETEFESLLKLVFPTLLTASVEPSLSKKRWLDVLKLSTLWEFTDFRRLAIAKLDGQIQSAEERVTLAKQHHISAWLVSGYAGFVNQREPIYPKQANAIGLLAAVRLYMLREARHHEIYRAMFAAGTGPPWRYTDDTATSTATEFDSAFDCVPHIEKSFSDELKVVWEHELRFNEKRERVERCSAVEEEEAKRLETVKEAGDEILRHAEAAERERVEEHEIEGRRIVAHPAGLQTSSAVEEEASNKKAAEDEIVRAEATADVARRSVPALTISPSVLAFNSPSSCSPTLSPSISISDLDFDEVQKRKLNRKQRQRLVNRAAEADAKRLEEAEAKRLEEEVEALEQEAETRRLAEEAEAKRLADVAEVKRAEQESGAKQEEAEAKRLAEEVETNFLRLEDEAEAMRVAQEYEAKRLQDAEEAELVRVDEVKKGAENEAKPVEGAAAVEAGGDATRREEANPTNPLEQAAAEAEIQRLKEEKAAKKKEKKEKRERKAAKIAAAEEAEAAKREAEGSDQTTEAEGKEEALTSSSVLANPPIPSTAPSPPESFTHITDKPSDPDPLHSFNRLNKPLPQHSTPSATEPTARLRLSMAERLAATAASAARAAMAEAAKEQKKSGWGWFDDPGSYKK